jgi:hypothetical protein
MKNIYIHIEINKCDLCGCCVGVCPHDALEMTETNLILIEEACTNCSKCVWSCPVEAIEFDKTKAIKNNEKI